jgi:hypothetical protein
MTKCEICNRETRAGYLWCDDCVAKWNDTPDTSLFVKWAIDRAREVEQEKNKSLLKEIERLKGIIKSHPCQRCVVGDFRASCTCKETDQ